MSVGLLRLLAHIHGHLGWLTAAALVHPAVLFRPRRTDVGRRLRRADGAVIASTAMVTVTALLGVLLYPEYRARIRPHLFAEAPTLGWLFERKEHLGLAAVLLAWTGAASYFAARTKEDGATDSLGRAAFYAFTAAALAATTVAAFGVAVATARSF